MDGFMVHCCKCDSGFEIDPNAVTCPKCAAKISGTQLNKCVFIKDCKVKYRGTVPPCYALVEKITSTNSSILSLLKHIQVRLDLGGPAAHKEALEMVTSKIEQLQQ